MKSSELSERRGTHSPKRFRGFVCFSHPYKCFSLDFQFETLVFFPQQLREYRLVLDTSLPAPLDTVACWLLKTEGALGEEEAEPQDHSRAADDAKEKQELLKVSFYLRIQRY